MSLIQWAKKHPDGYEVSSHGDRRFSALYATMPDGRTIEQWYQCDVKGYQPKGTNWKLGKGKPPLHELPGDWLWEMYLSLWRLWALQNPDQIQELWDHATNHEFILTDMFVTTPINQARALATILNEWVASHL